MKQACSRPRHASRGYWGLIEILIVVLIIAAGAGLYIGITRSQEASLQAVHNELGTPATTNAPGQPQSLAGQVIDDAKAVKCKSNLQQLRQLISIAQSEGKLPATLDEIEGAKQIDICPVCNKPYNYDPTTGKVSCSYPGHENY